MIVLPNYIVQKLIRYLPLILDNMDKEKMRKSVRLQNAVRLTKICINRLKKIENERYKNKKTERS